MPEGVQTFLELPYVLKLRAATSTGGWLPFTNEAGRTSDASPPEPDWRLEAHLLYPGLIRASIQYQPHVWSQVLTQPMRGTQSAEPAEITASSERGPRG